MERRLSSYIGCLLGLATGDALGYGMAQLGPEERRAGEEAPLENGYLPTTSHTQLAAYGCNGLLVGVTRGQLSGAMAPPVRYIAQALQEWAGLQAWKRGGGRPQCWISRSPRLDYRRCMEPQMLDVLAGDTLGTMEERQSGLCGPGALMAAVAVGLFFDPGRLPRREIQRLGAEAAALTHGDPAAFLSGAALAHIISRITWDGAEDLEGLARETGAMLKKRFGREYHQAGEVSQKLLMARTLAKSKRIGRQAALEQLGCATAAQVLAGAVYCCLTGGGDAAACVRESAEYAAAGAAVVGAIQGALRGAEAIPEEWVEKLECGSVLRELAEDMFRGCPMMLGSRVFDVEWDAKYVSPEL